MSKYDGRDSMFFGRINTVAVIALKKLHDFYIEIVTVRVKSRIDLSMIFYIK